MALTCLKLASALSTSALIADVGYIQLTPVTNTTLAPTADPRDLFEDLTHRITGESGDVLGTNGEWLLTTLRLSSIAVSAVGVLITLYEVLVAPRGGTSQGSRKRPAGALVAATTSAI